MSNIYCTAPFNGITVRENGDVKTCCVGNTVLGNLNDLSIEDILESNNLKQIQQQMLSGSTDLKNCNTCYSHETHSGVSPLRQHYLKFYPNVSDKVQLKNLDIRWNNLCNLGCVYCSSTFSSIWEERLSTRLNKAVKPYQDDLLDFILNNIDQTDEIMLVGGEPMLMKQNYQLLEQLPLSAKISIITNFSYNLERLPCFESLLKRPRENIRWNLSLENSGEKFEYVRNGASWQQVEKNFKVLNQHWPDTSSITMVYSMFTAFDIDESIERFQQHNINKFILQPYFGHPAFDVFSMPDAIKKVALEKLKRALDAHVNNIHPEDKDLYPIDNINQIIEHLEKPENKQTAVTKQSFYDRVEWCNQWNQNRFQDLWPNIIDLVDVHLK